MRVAAGHLLHRLIAELHTKETLRFELNSLVGTVLAAADAEHADEERSACGGMPIRLFHQITSIAGDAMLPHVAGAARSLAARCADELANGHDMTESVPLEVIGALAEMAQDLWSALDDDDEEDADEADDADDAEDGAPGDVDARPLRGSRRRCA